MPAWPASGTQGGNDRVVVHAPDLMLAANLDEARRQTKGRSERVVHADRCLVRSTDLIPGATVTTELGKREARSAVDVRRLPRGDTCRKRQDEQPNAVRRSVKHNLRAQDGGKLTAVEQAIRAVERGPTSAIQIDRDPEPRRQIVPILRKLVVQ